MQSSGVGSQRIEHLDRRLGHLERGLDDLSHRIELDFTRTEDELRQLQIPRSVRR